MYDAGNPKPMLCDNLGGCDGEGDEKQVQDGGNISIHNVDSCWCMAKTHNMQSNYPLIKKKREIR